MTRPLASRLVESLPDALRVRRLRNTCARYMTNSREPISRWSQVRWYFMHYRRARREGRYRVYLFLDTREPVGYGALQLEDENLLVTECVASEHRGRGIGTAILDALVALGRREGRDLLAEIWTSNRPSVSLHEKAGFRLERTLDHEGSELSLYRLRGS